jgi:hypothetical protein
MAGTDDAVVTDCQAIRKMGGCIRAAAEGSACKLDRRVANRLHRHDSGVFG